MSERTEQQRKRAMQEKRRQRNKIIRRRRAIFFGGIVVIIVALVLIISVIVKNITGDIVSTNTLTLTEKGVTFEEVSSTEDLSKSDVKSYAKEIVKEYNAQSDKGSVKLDKVSEKKDVVYVKTTYDSVDTYSEFSGYEAFSGTIAEAKKAGYDFSSTFVSVAKGKKGDVADTETVTEDDSLNVLIIRENATYVVDGNIVYVSDENTTVTNSTTVSTVSDEESNDSAVLTYIIYK